MHMVGSAARCLPTRAPARARTSTCTGWRTVHCRPHSKWWSCAVTRGGYLDVSSFRPNCKMVRISWDSDCITQLPPLGVELISDPSTAAVFGWTVDRELSTLSLYRLDESSGWRCLYSGLPPQLHPRRIHVQATKILGNMVILVFPIWAQVSREQDAYCSLAMAYHMHDGSCQWFRLPDQAFLFDSTAGHKSVFPEPTLVSHLRL